MIPWAGKHVLVLGDVMLDRTVRGTADRICPEAPVPVLKATGTTDTLGGAGNVACNLSALGVDSRLVGVVGDDPTGGRILAMASRQDRLMVEPGRVTPLKTRYVSGQQLLRVDQETTRPTRYTSGLIGILRSSVRDWKPDAIVLSDYAKGTLPQPLISEAIGLAREVGIPTVVDPKGLDFGRYRGATVIKPNYAEYEAASPDQNDFGAILVTRGPEGMALVEPDGLTVIAAEPKRVFDVAGAGDTVAAVLGAGLAGGMALIEAAELAGKAAGMVVEKPGVATVSASELFGVADKVLTWEQAAEQTAAWQDEGCTVGFANGCFDLFHEGHDYLLHEAEKACNRLIVGLNSDESVSRLKGRDRPLWKQPVREAAIAMHEAVDAVVTFGQDTPQELIAAIRPDVLIKGSDYTEDQVVGADLVKRRGGRVVLVERTEHSTTELKTAS